jgi:hypothetical protein
VPPSRRSDFVLQPVRRIDTQVKEIQSGQAQDTGLLVGDEATSSSVQTVQLDPNTLSIPSAQANGPAGAVNIDTPTPST